MLPTPFTYYNLRQLRLVTPDVAPIFKIKLTEDVSVIIVLPFHWAHANDWAGFEFHEASWHCDSVNESTGVAQMTFYGKSSDAVRLVQIDQLRRLSLEAEAPYVAPLAGYGFPLGFHTVSFAAHQHQQRVNQIKASTTLANNLCPDHRDKQYGKTCLACRIEKLEKAIQAVLGFKILSPGATEHLTHILEDK